MFSRTIPWVDTQRYNCLICGQRGCSFQFFDERDIRIATSCLACCDAMEHRVRDTVALPAFLRDYEKILALDT